MVHAIWTYEPLTFVHRELREPFESLERILTVVQH